MSGNERIINRTAQRRKRNRRKKLIIRACFGGIFLLVGVVIVLTMFFNINEITVTGDTIYAPDEIINASEVNVGDNLIFVSKKKINNNITETLPYVGAVKVKRHLPTVADIIFPRFNKVIFSPINSVSASRTFPFSLSKVK